MYQTRVQLPPIAIVEKLRALASPPASKAASNAVGGSPASVAELGAFWARWGAAIDRARPEVPGVALNGTAPRIEAEDDGARKPYRDLAMLDDGAVESLRNSHAQFLQEVRNGTGGDTVFKGRGVVMVGGGEFYGPAIIGIQMLRRTGSSLPVEIFVPNDDEYEPELCEKYLPKLNARCVVLSHILSHSSAPVNISHFQLKAPSLLLSSFDEVLMLDSDSIPLVDPSRDLFDMEPYLSSGLVVWPDHWSATESPKFWTIAGLPEFPPHLPVRSGESGQMAANKKTHLASLLLATYYNMYGPDHYYPLLSQGGPGQGDKETFLAAAVAANETYYRIKTKPTRLSRWNGANIMSTAMVQYLPFDDWSHAQGKAVDAIRPAFLHSNSPKMNAGHLVDEGSLLTIDKSRHLRLLGSEAEQDQIFGFDIEKTLLDLLVQDGCELASIIEEWKHREEICQRLEEHRQELSHGL